MCGAAVGERACQERAEDGGNRCHLYFRWTGGHRQRAFRDALADLLPPVHGFGPTIRIGYFQVEGWIWDEEPATERLAELVGESGCWVESLTGSRLRARASLRAIGRRMGTDGCAES